MAAELGAVVPNAFTNWMLGAALPTFVGAFVTVIETNNTAIY